MRTLELFSQGAPERRDRTCSRRVKPFSKA
jgi:hypothetical protein